MVYNEWFYISRWRENNKETWVVLNKKNKEIVKERMTKHTADELAFDLNTRDDNSNFVVNMKDELYYEYVNNSEVKIENKNNQK